jgi:hypothetical protein
MQPAADFHDQSTDARLPQAASVGNHAPAFDAAGEGFNTHAATSDTPLRRFLRPWELPSSRLPGRQAALHPVERECQTAQRLEQPAAGGHGVRGGIGDALVMGAARLGVTAKEAREGRIDSPPIFHRVAFLLATLTARLLRRSLGPLEAPCGALVANRGAAGGATGVDGSWVGTTNAVAAAAATPRCCASPVTERVGASPSVDSVACRTPNRT